MELTTTNPLSSKNPIQNIPRARTHYGVFSQPHLQRTVQCSNYQRSDAIQCLAKGFQTHRVPHTHIHDAIPMLVCCSLFGDYLYMSIRIGALYMQCKIKHIIYIYYIYIYLVYFQMGGFKIDTQPCLFKFGELAPMYT